MSKRRSMSAEELLEDLRERLAPTLARIAIQIHRDEQRARDANRDHEPGGGKAA